MSDDAALRPAARPEADDQTPPPVPAPGEMPPVTAMLPAPRRRAGRRHTVVILGTAVVATVLAVLAGTSHVATTAQLEQAATPPLAQLSAVSEGPAATLSSLARTAAKAPAPTGDSVTITYQTWTLPSNGDAHQYTAAPFIQPQDVTVVHSGDTVHVTTKAGTPYAPTGAAVIPASAEPAGTVLDQYRMQNPVPLPPDSARAWTDYLQRTFGMDAAAPAGEVLRQLPSILDFHRLDAAQTSSLLDYLSTVPALELAGAGADRLGRRGVVFIGPTTDAAYQTRATVDAHTGRVLAIEVVYTGPDRADLTSPCVTEYTAWK